MVVQQGRRRSKNRRRNVSHPPTPSCQDSSFPQVGYVEDFCELRTKRGTRRVLARQGWVGEKSGFFNSLLRCEELFGVSRRKTAELSAVAGAIQDRHFKTLQRELLAPDLFECGDTERESSLEFRGLREPFLL